MSHNIHSHNDRLMMAEETLFEEKPSDPPLESTYKSLISDKHDFLDVPVVVDESELPLIDLNHLNLGDSSRQACKKEIAKASREWGFFRVVNHGIPSGIVETMRAEQVKLFKKPFEEKKACKGLNFSPGSYRWGTPTATTLQRLSWSEAFHVPMSDMFGSGGHDSLSSTMEQYSTTVSELAQTLAAILAEELTGSKTSLFKETCLPTSCYLRLNRYPACPRAPRMLGIAPHTDSSFLTVLHEDNIGGLQLVKNGEWIAVKPKPHTLTINIGDLFQAWSNDTYKSVEHRVVANPLNERFSIAYFFCPTHEAVIQSGRDYSTSTCLYRSFSFGEFKRQVKEDVEIYGHKIGLPRFIAPHH